MAGRLTDEAHRMAHTRVPRLRPLASNFAIYRLLVRPLYRPQVLNRAMPEKLDKERKTISGRVFKR